MHALFLDSSPQRGDREGVLAANECDERGSIVSCFLTYSGCVVELTKPLSVVLCWDESTG